MQDSTRVFSDAADVQSQRDCHACVGGLSHKQCAATTHTPHHNMGTPAVTKTRTRHVHVHKMRHYIQPSKKAPTLCAWTTWKRSGTVPPTGCPQPRTRPHHPLLPPPAPPAAVRPPGGQDVGKWARSVKKMASWYWLVGNAHRHPPPPHHHWTCTVPTCTTPTNCRFVVTT